MVNHLSDSVSIVEVDPTVALSRVSRTLLVGDEPRDIVFAGSGGFATGRIGWVTCAGENGSVTTVAMPEPLPSAARQLATSL